MGFLKKLFGGGAAEEEMGDDDHTVRVQIQLAGGDFGDKAEVKKWGELEMTLDRAVRAANVGRLDGNEIGFGEYEIWLYGPDAKPLLEVVRANLPPLPAGAALIVRHGGLDDESAEEETIAVGG